LWRTARPTSRAIPPNRRRSHRHPAGEAAQS
jgi:hypothetical protein